jgi:hypothetical protein
LRGKVKAVLDASLPDGATRVTIHLASGETLDEIVMEAKGSLADPLTDRDIEAKSRDGARLGGTDWDIEGIIDGVWNLDTLADVSDLMGTHGFLKSSNLTVEGTKDERIIRQGIEGPQGSARRGLR